MIDTREAIERVLREFLAAFERCDLPAMGRYFASDATSFPQAIMSPATPADVDPDAYRRCAGMPADMQRLARELPAQRPGPPYHALEPQDLDIRVFDGAALATFHLERPGSLGRRTIVLARTGDDWKIVHLHASRVERA
ncbi:MAG: nuclear transport factor 2 family protein [Gammaproteobacteria bacterium]|nr:nuclear transport factor 2 family protein [Gammaproteobacteria bacterium]